MNLFRVGFYLLSACLASSITQAETPANFFRHSLHRKPPGNLQKAQFREVRARPRIDFCGADLAEADLQSAVFPQGQFRDLHGAKTNWIGAHLMGSDFRGADLRNARFQGADLSFAKFDQADLTGADLRDAFVLGASFCGARMDAEAHKKIPAAGFERCP